MDNLAVGEDAPVCPDEVEDRRADCQIHHRAYDLERDAVNEDERRVRIAVSSDVPVERAFGTEVLDHSADAIDLSFLGSGRAPLLLDHDMTRQIGVVEEVTIDGEARRTRATVRFGKSALANDVFQDVVDGIRSNVSVGYRIDDLSKEERDDGTVFRATRWSNSVASYWKPSEMRDRWKSQSLTLHRRRSVNSLSFVRYEPQRPATGVRLVTSAK